MSASYQQPSFNDPDYRGKMRKGLETAFRMFEKFAQILKLRIHTVQLHRQKNSLMRQLGEQTYGSLKVDQVEVNELKPIVTKIDEISLRIDMTKESISAIRYAQPK